MPLIRTRQDIDAIPGGPTPAEEKLLADCLAGEGCILGTAVPPEGKPNLQVLIRADVLRYLITGGCADHRVADRGVDVRGAHVSGALDLNFARARGETTLMHCRFDSGIQALQAQFEFLHLGNSAVPGLNAQGVQVTGGVFLRGITTEAEVRLSSATIGGALECEGAAFNAPTGHALNAQGVQVTGDVFLRDVTAEAEVSLTGATIGGQLSCTGAAFNAATGTALNAQGVQVTGDVVLSDITAEAVVSLSGATIGGQLACDGANFNAAKGIALNAQRLTVKSGFFFREVSTKGARIGLIAAHVSDLLDDPQSWPQKGKLDLDGFTYDRLYNFDFPRVADRLDWLARGISENGEFYPQPYTQLAKVYREMGHDADARAVLYDRERQRRLHQRARARVRPTGDLDVALHSLWQDIRNLIRLIWDVVLRAVVGYGVRPFRSLWSLAALTLLATFLAHMAWEEGSMAPNSPVVLTSNSWLQIAEDDAVQNPGALWSDRHSHGRDYATFNRYAYAADLVIPIIDLGQTDAWAPSTNRKIWGERLWRYGFFLTVAGWIVTALGAAAITGIIRRD